MRWRALLPLLLTVVAGLVGAAPAVAAAPTVAAITTQLGSRASYVDPTVRPRVTPVALQRMAARYPGVRFVVLNALPRGVTSGPAAAQAILSGLDRPATVAVWRRRQLFVASSSEPEARVNEALRRARRQTDKRAVPLLERFAVLLTQPASPAPAARDDDDDGGRPIWQWLLAAAAAGLAALGALRLRQRSREARARRRGGSLSTAKDFHAARLDALSARHAGLVREVADRPDDAGLAEHFELARGKVTALRRSLPTLHSPRELRTCAGELDEVEWHLEAAQALIAGSAVPDRPLRDRPGLCFFTHEHGLAHHEIEVDRPNGVTAKIRVSDANYEALSRGEAPFVSQVHVGSRLLPWPAAPTWYGAAGWTPADLPGLEVAGREIWGRDTPQRETAARPHDAAEPGGPPPDAGRAVASGTRRRPGLPSDPTRASRPFEAGTAPGEPTSEDLPPRPRTVSRPEPTTQSQMWEELDESPPAGLNREAAARAIGPPDAGEPPAADEAGGLRRGEDTVAFDPFAEPVEDPSGRDPREGRPRRGDA